MLDEGTYELKLQTDSHSMAEGIEPIEYEVGETVVFDQENP
ncbi:hypothetical protein [Nesterenkonia pannonica]|nr:hypothetical protein [Nesterenkonia pannonica]